MSALLIPAAGVGATVATVITAAGAAWAWLLWRWLRSRRRQERQIQTAQAALAQAEATIGRLQNELSRAAPELARLRQAELQAQQAASASLAKTRFLASMSHELRTPLNAVIGATQLLHCGTDEAQRQLVDVIRDSGSRLLGLIENVLDLSRIEAGALVLSDEDFDLVECVEAAVATAAMQARLKGLSLVCHIEPQLAAWRRGDPTRLRQVLLNLFGNAIKFTPRGEVQLRVAEAGQADAVVMQVVDTGPGIDPALLPQLFEAFRQAPAVGARRSDGAGLGLTITRQLVHAMGGQVQARSTPGQGSTFSVNLPLPPARQAEPPRPLRRTLMVYEPHDASADALAALLQRMGCAWRRVLDVTDLGAALVDHHSHGLDPQPPWLLVALDGELAVPMLNAATTLMPLRQVIAMDGPAARGDASARALHHMLPRIHKPVLRAALFSRLALRDLAPAAAQAVPGAASRRVLVVDDDSINQTIACGMLHHAGHRTAVAGTGEQALQMLAAESFDLVLMDWQMPGLDGLEVTRRLRAGAAGARARGLPVVALTANAFADDRAACLDAGMDDFLTKPLRADRLCSTVAHWLEQRGGHDALLAPSDYAALH